MGDDELVLNIVSEPAVEPYPNKRRRIKGRPAPPDSGAPSSVQSIQQRGLVTRGAKRGRTRGGGKTVGRAHIPSSRPPAASPSSAVAVSPVPAAASVSPVPSAAPGTAPTGGAVAKASSERGQKKRIRMPRRERFLHYEFKESDVFSADSFEGMGLSGRLVAHMKDRLKLDKPTHIQRASVPPLLEGRDVLIKAETGSGKTLAYLLPIVQMLLAPSTPIQRSQGAYAIVVAPTRELSLQIYDVLYKLVQPFPWIVPGIVMGGEKKKSEKARLRKGVTILVAPPGRLLDHLQNTASFKVENLRYLVLDEADRLLDMGFERDVKQIVKTLDERAREAVACADGADGDEKKRATKAAARPLRQSALISATLNPEIKRLVGTVMRSEPVYVSVASKLEEANKEERADKTAEDVASDSISTPPGLDQSYAIVPCKKRLVTLAAFLQWQARIKKDCKLIVFASSIASVEFFYTLFGRALWPKACVVPNEDSTETEEEDSTGSKRPLLQIPLFKLHGDLSQVDRTKIYFAFCKAERGILFSTDVAARGLDLPAVNWIVQYDPPAEPTEYIHRVGRTARLGHCGRALIFLLPSEEPYAELLQTQYHLTLHKVSTASILKTLPAPSNKTDDFEGATILQTHFEWMVRNDKEGDLHGLAKASYGSFVRAYATHTAATKHIFHIKSLHLGHVAKSFALGEPPSKLHGKKGKQKSSGSERKKSKEDKDGSKERGGLGKTRQGTWEPGRISAVPKKRKLIQMSEFAAF